MPIYNRLYHSLKFKKNKYVGFKLNWKYIEKLKIEHKARQGGCIKKNLNWNSKERVVSSYTVVLNTLYS